MTPIEKRQLRELRDALKVVSTEHGSLPVRQILALIVTALHEGDDGSADMRKIGRECNAPSAVVSRDLLGLGKRTRTGKPGAGLVESFEDYTDLRRKPYRLTSAGVALLRRMIAFQPTAVETTVDI